jgi:dATP pyrophosphohydrolase
MKRERAPFQVLVLPFTRDSLGMLLYLVLRRDASTGGYWQFVAGGGEEGETPIEAARREGAEEAGIDPTCDYKPLDSISTIPVVNVCGFRWGKEKLVIPEYCFGANLGRPADIQLSSEHTEYRWVSYETAQEMLQWDSNKSALWELDHRLRNTTHP